MRNLAMILLLAGLGGCEQLIGLDDLKVGEEQDSESDWLGEPCVVEVLGSVEMDGVCQLEDDPCSGGTNPGNEAGDCEGDDLVCCVYPNQCESYAPALHCQDGTCSDEGGWPIGCPDGQWCCPGM
jgi:hypothetical protein